MSRSNTSHRVAVIGIAFRLPGATRDSLWPSLLEGRNLVTTVDPARWAKESFFHPRKSEPGASYSFAAGSIGDISGFDASFFGISPREAAQMDPQQRLLLELSWEALEAAAVKPSTLRGSDCGVFVGLSSVDYSYNLAYDLASMDASSATGNTASIAANRLSYFYDLHGPSMVVDTACSSSLVAFHQACQSIAIGETRQALVGGVSLHLHPYGFIAFSKASMLSKRGACRVFDSAGDGYVRSEGAGVLVLKDLDRAVADGNPILAVVAASGVNTAGRSASLTVPNVDAQAALLSDVYERAGIDPAEIDYLEAHGTGTVVGDPIETRALGIALGRLRPRHQPLPIGSVKSNLGHLEAASGIAGLVKALHCLKHRAVPPTIHLDSPNPNIHFDEWNLKAVVEPLTLHPYKKLVVGVNSFGFGGANAHVVLESTPTSPKAVEASQGEVALMLSGHDDAALRDVAASYANFLQAGEQPALHDIAFTTVHCRDWHAQRAIVVGTDRAGIAAALAQFAKGHSTPGIVSGRALPNASGPAFVYSGNGSQWPGMGRSLLAEDPVFRAAVQAVDAIFRPLAGFSIVEKLEQDVVASDLDHTEIAQPLLFAVQVGLTELLRHWGIQPARVTGHSVGEVAAAWASGALSLEDAVRVIYHRSRFQGETKGAGAMTAVGLAEDAARRQIEALVLTGEVNVACINSSRNVTLVGTRAGIEAVEAELTQRKVFHRRLDLDYAFHSKAMDPVRDGLVTALRGLAPRATKAAFHSAVTGSLAAGNQLDATYWWSNIREPVRFQAAIRGIAESGTNVFIEIGPHPILKNYINDGLRAASIEGRALVTLQRSASDRAAIRAAAQEVVITGCPVETAKLLPAQGHFVELPPYPWQRERHWREPTSQAYDLIHHGKQHPLLGYRLHENDFQWENHLDTALYPAYADHVVGGAVVFPAAGFVEMALAASALAHGGDAHEVETLEIRSALLLEDGASKTVRFTLEPDGRFAIRSRARLSEDPWQLHVVGKLVGAPTEPQRTPRQSAPSRKPDVLAAQHYEAAARAGLAYGPAFQAVSKVWLDPADPGSAYARLVLPKPIRGELGVMHLHPASLDGCFQLLVDILRAEASRHVQVAFVPVQVGRARLYGASALVTACRVRLTARSTRSLVADFELYGPNGDVVASLAGVRFRGVQLKQPQGARLRYLSYRAIPRLAPGVAPEAKPLPLAVLAATCGERWQALSAAGSRKRYYDEVEPLSDVLCSSFAEHALRQRIGEAPLIDPAALAASTPAEHWPLLKRAIQMLVEDQLLEPAEGGWRWSPVTELPDAQESWITLLRDYPDEAGQLVALGRAGAHLAEVFAGKEASLPGLLPSTHASVFARLCSGAPAFANAGRAIAETLALALGRLPAQRPLRVLEVTPCRSEITLRVLQAVDLDRCEYHVGCTTEEALGEYEGVLDALPNVEACVADLQVPGMGLKAPSQGPFDVVIVSDGLLGAADPDAAAAHLSGALAEDGLLILVAQHPSRWTDLLFGADPAWWTLGPSGSQRSRLRSPDEWRIVLAHMGFGAMVAVPELPGLERGSYILMARRDGVPAPAAERGVPAQSGWIFVQEAGGYAAAFGACVQADLRARGHAVFEMTPGGSDGAAAASAGHELAQLAKARQTLGEISGIAFLAGLPDDAAATGDAAERLARQTARCDSLARLLRACKASSMTPAVWVVTSGAASSLARNVPALASRRRPADPDEAIVWGFGRTAMNEYPELRLRLVDCPNPENLERNAAALVHELLAPTADDEVILTGAGRYALRLGALPAPANERTATPGITRLDFAAPGPLKNLAWRGDVRRKPRAGEVEIEVRAAGLNFRDVMYAMGLLSDEAVEGGFAGAALGMELSGVVTAIGKDVTAVAPGDEVLAFAPSAFASHVVTAAGSVAKKPAGWTFESAATVPTAFFTVYYSLKHLAQLREGERVLIHGAAGGVGIAAIQVAKWLGAEIFATAGSDEKRDFVRLLGADHVLDSRTLSFADEILRLTNGEGVDVVLNSLSGEAIARNLRALRPFGRFIELGKRDYYENTHIGLRPFRNNISYFGVDADQLMKERPDLARQLFNELMQLFEQGVLSPLPYRAFAATEAVEAFRYMQHSRQIGKVVLSFADGVKAQPARAAVPRELALSPNATYLVTGGLSGFGLRTAQWLVDKGARHLVLVSKSGAESLETKAAVADLEALGATVIAEACDITDRASVQRLLAEVTAALPPLRGVIHAAAVIHDGFIANMPAAQIRDVLAPKTLGARHLDELTRNAKLDFFVLYSSATTLFGNPGQANYIAANCFLEALAKARRDEGLPALCVGWGAIGDVGYLARHEKVKEALQTHMGGTALESEAALAVLEQLLLTDTSGLGVLDFSWRNLRRFLPTAASPRFRELGARGEDGQGDDDGRGELRRLANELDAAELSAMFTDLLRREVGEILRIAPDRLDTRQPLQEMGMDSLMGVELLTAVEARFGVNLPVMSLSEQPSIEKLVERIVRALKDPNGSPEPESRGDQIERVAAQYAGELDARQIEELTQAIDEAQAGTQRGRP